MFTFIIHLILFLIGLALYLCTIPMSIIKIALKLDLKRLEFHTEKIQPKLHDKLRKKYLQLKKAEKKEDAGDKAIEHGKTTAKNTIKIGTRISLRTKQVVDKIRIVMLKFTIFTLKYAIKLFRWIASLLGVSSIVGMLIAIFLALALVAACSFGIISFNSNTTGDKSTTKKHLTYQGTKTSDSALDGVGDPDLKKLKKLATWYIKHVNTYQCSPKGVKGTGTKKYYTCEAGVIFKKASSLGDDCTAFASAYMCYVAGHSKKDFETYSKPMAQNSSEMKHWSNDGWKCYKWDKIGSVKNLQPGDILLCNSDAGLGSGHHAEVYIDSKHTFGWGSIKDHYPTDNAITKTSSGFRDNGHTYVRVWRYVGKGK